MHSTNGRGLRRAVLYARVSIEEQARPGYSLAQQIGAGLYRATPGAWLRPRDRRAAPKRRQPLRRVGVNRNRIEERCDTQSIGAGSLVRPAQEVCARAGGVRRGSADASEIAASLD
jgi:hypothetical protein